MQQRDLIMAQIEQLSKVLQKILAKFLGVKPLVDIQERIQDTQKALKEELDIDIEVVLTIKGEELSRYFSLKKLAPQHIELLGDYLAKIAESIKEMKEKSHQYYYKSLDLYDIVNSNSNEYSLERLEKEKRIKKQLE